MHGFRLIWIMSLFSGCLPVAQAQALLERRLTETKGLQSNGGVAADKAGNEYLVSSANEFDGQRLKDKQYVWGLMKYGPDGKKLWTRMWGEGSYGTPKGMATGPLGNVYVVGEMKGANISKFDSTGVETWSLYTNQEDTSQEPRIFSRYFQAIAVDSAENVFAAGSYSEGVLLAKYTSDGQLVWERTFPISCGKASGLAMDKQGNLYLTGRSDGHWDGQLNHGSGDIFLLKCSNAGEKVWVRQYGTARMDWGTYAAVDPSGNVLSVGLSERAPSKNDGGYSSGHEVILFRHDKDGNLIYEKKAGTTHTSLLDGFVHSGDGGFYGTLLTRIEAPSKRNKGEAKFRGYLVKYGTDGEKIWSSPTGMLVIGLGTAMGKGTAVDPKGFIYTLGFYANRRQAEDSVCLLKFAPYAPSFDCFKASTPQEALICGSQKLSQLDDTLSQLYSAARKCVPDAAKLKSEQVQWVNGERSQCTTVEKLADCMGARIKVLEKITCR